MLWPSRFCIETSIAVRTLYRKATHKKVGVAVEKIQLKMPQKHKLCTTKSYYVSIVRTRQSTKFYFTFLRHSKSSKFIDAVLRHRQSARTKDMLQKDKELNRKLS